LLIAIAPETLPSIRTIAALLVVELEAKNC
jgi:hypothetical protein